MWWYKHLAIITMQIIAFIPYIIGSLKFYRYKNKFMGWIAVGISLDIMMALTPFIFTLPRMEDSQGAPWSSPLFIIHISSAGIGMIGFICMFSYLLIKGTKKPYVRLRKFQYKVLLRLWIFGVGIALINFLIKIMFNIRIYDYI